MKKIDFNDEVKKWKEIFDEKLYKKEDNPYPWMESIYSMYNRILDSDIVFYSPEEKVYNKITNNIELYNLLDSKKIKTIYFVRSNRIKINDDDLLTYDLCFERDVAYDGLVFSYLKKKRNFIISHDLEFAFNMDLYDWEELKKSTLNIDFNVYKEKIELTAFENTFMLDKKMTDLLFERYPELKMLYLRKIKKFISTRKKALEEITEEIRTRECNSVYELTDEDKLIMEVIED